MTFGAGMRARRRLEAGGFTVWEVAASADELGPLEPLADIVVGQCIVVECAQLRGTDPDRPPGLEKVTQT